MVSRHRSSWVHGVEVYVPSPEDDIYLVGTHAFGHMRFTLAEILHGLHVLSGCGERFDWDYLLNTAKIWGCLDGLFFFLKVLDKYSETVRGDASIPADVMNECRKHRVCRKIDVWLDREFSLNFPIAVPVSIGCVLSSIYHCRTLVGVASPSELLADFLSHYLVLGSRLVGTGHT